MTTQDQIRGELLAAIAQARVAAERTERVLEWMAGEMVVMGQKTRWRSSRFHVPPARPY